MSTYHIHIDGLVQGVGFRPFVYQLAGQFKLNGWVNNSKDGVHVEFNADDEIATLFYQSLIRNAPALSTIRHHHIFQTNPITYDHFEIRESKTADTATLMLTPDFAMCKECKIELHDPGSRRYRYPFITCTQCGPRYSIVNGLPYDREKTSMHFFEQCHDCKQEYQDPANRRHYSQTNSCDHCGVSLFLYSAKGERMPGSNQWVTEKIVEALSDKKIVAVKGIGGYLILCDAGDESLVNDLRRRKSRPAKPFALLYPDMSAVTRDFDVSIREAESLQSPAAPIILLTRRATHINNLASQAIAPGLSKMGVMLPYTPLFELIVSAFQQPLIATSANIADSPIVYTDDDALMQLRPFVDYIVTNNREILTAQDDSVMKYTPLHQQPVVIRRARGLAPSYLHYAASNQLNILATGALLKSSFCFSCNGNVYISQYLGNTDSYEAQEAYKKVVQHFIRLFGQLPGSILTDTHPLYFSEQYGRQLSEHFHCPLLKIQHHKAHAAAVLAENNLLQSAGSVLCVIWDGTGLGDDGNIWGGEFFTFQNNELTRSHHFDYFPVIAGDRMARAPKLSAFAVAHELRGANEILEKKFSVKERQLYRRLIENGPAVWSSSLGRIFDAVASLLEICDIQSYEGEAAMLLEELAGLYFQQHGYAATDCYFTNKIDRDKVSTEDLIGGILNDIHQGLSKELIAAKFHYSLAILVSVIAGNLQTQKICFSGGVFQNSVLIDLLIEHLGKDFQLYFHRELSANDENISFGQLVYFDNNIDHCNSGRIEEVTNLVKQGRGVQ